MALSKHKVQVLTEIKTKHLAAQIEILSTKLEKVEQALQKEKKLRSDLEKQISASQIKPKTKTTRSRAKKTTTKKSKN